MKSQMTDFTLAGNCPRRGASGFAGAFSAATGHAHPADGPMPHCRSRPPALQKMPAIEDRLEATAMCPGCAEHRDAPLFVDWVNQYK